MLPEVLGFSILFTQCIFLDLDREKRTDFSELEIFSTFALPSLHTWKSLQWGGAEEMSHYFQVTILLTLKLHFRLIEPKYMLPRRRKHDTF